MRLTSKLIFAIALGIVLVLGVNALLYVRAEAETYRAHVRRDHELIARGLARTVELTWRASGPELARTLVEDFNAREALLSVHLVGAGEAAPRLPALIANDRVVHSQVLGGPSPMMLTYVRLAVPNVSGPIAIEIDEPLGRNEDDYRDVLMMRTLGTTTGLVVLCSLLALGFGIFFVARPMRALTEKAERIGAGDFAGRIVMNQRDEIRDLGRAMNDMCDRLEEARGGLERESLARLEALDQLRHADRLRTVGELASGIAHELGTPLAVVRARGAMIAGGELDEGRTRAAGTLVVDHVDRMAGVIRRLLDFARRRPAERREGDLVRVVDAAVRFVSPLADKADVEVIWQLIETKISMPLDDNQLQQALANLVVNAIHAVGAGGHVEITVERVGALVEVRVDDDGPGVAPAQREHVFEPFFTTKPAGEGTGLGLTVALGIVREHGGAIACETSPRGGARFVVRLPLDARASGTLRI